MGNTLTLWVSNFIVVLVCGCISQAHAADPVPQKPFPEQVRELLASEWTELSITQVLVPDDGRILAAEVRLTRETAKSAVYWTLPLEKVVPEKVVLKEGDVRAFYADIKAGAEAAFKHKYPIEIFHSLPPDKAREMVKSGKLKVEPTDGEMLIIRGKGAAGEVRLEESGPCPRLDARLLKLYKAKLRELTPEETKAILGVDPHEGL